MDIPDRQQRIVEYLADRQSASVSELSDLLSVSAVTVRSDLNQLAEQGRVIRTHGGAQIMGDRYRQEFTFANRQRINALQKQRIGELAAGLIQPYDSILLDASTTAVALARAIRCSPNLQDVTVMTTGIWTALELLGCPGIHVLLPGGNLRSITGSITGVISRNVLSEFNFQKVFLGAWGLTLEEGLMDTPLAEVELKRAIVARTQDVIAIVDSSKLGRLGLASFAGLERIRRIVTDDGAAPDIIHGLRLAGIEVLMASTET
jgi:DeoR/GlpR family transcriptional regulator of sugar metabolism